MVLEHRVKIFKGIHYSIGKQPGASFLSEELTPEITDWLYENCSHNWWVRYREFLNNFTYITFEDELEAMAFKLKWI